MAPRVSQIDRIRDEIDQRLHSGGDLGAALEDVARLGVRLILQRELLNRRSWATHKELVSAIFEWIEAWYNRPADTTHRVRAF